MTQTQPKVTFTKNYGFRKELNRRVDAYFQSQNISTRDNPAMYIKTAVLFSWVISAWVFTLFGPPQIWIKLISCIFLGLGIAGVAFNVGHDANHGAYSRKKIVNNILGITYDIIGLSSYLWKFRHNFLHHKYTNLLGHDVEIHGGGLVRMTVYVEHKWYHSFQHIFIWLIYTIIPFYWSIHDIGFITVNRKYHTYDIPKLKPIDLLIFVSGKFIWLGLFLGIPITIGYTPIQALIGFCITYMTYGLVSITIFMLAHVMEAADFIESSGDLKIEDEWAIFQTRTTVDFAPNNQFLTWYLGGLNYQVVHHLFPNICHIHYPQISKILADVCQDFGVKYNVCPNFSAALASNYRWLKLMGTAPHLD
ncbi:fatty acid desaturase family protein [Anabaena sp. CS-542/02]|uniref:fatty acid desaturase family protein n=1 Tax=Anabaena sp. CS-542/02 TaxID=3021719 RepID=UPI00232E3C6A|nr:acyl-CoA desaturase [Anabaena sp. CS-542/02]MDB9445197.1 acyl-CoA desaturase [Anabaena sp. CS-542/02]